MTVTYTNAKAALVTIASALATEATSTGQTALATALTNLSTEISGQSVTETEFFGGFRDVGDPGGNDDIYGSAALVWSDILTACSTAIRAKSDSTMATQQTTMATQQTTMATQQTTIATQQTTIAAQTTIIANEITTIDNHLNRLQSTVDDITLEETDEQGTITEFNAGPHVRNIATGWYNEGGFTDWENRRIARGMMIINLKATNKLDDLRAELVSPTTI